MQKPVPASYAQTSYHAEHAFLSTAADASRRFGRYHFVPEAGEASLSSAAEERRLIFDPTNRTDGIEFSADPILLARSAAYSISYERRRKGE